MLPRESSFNPNGMREKMDEEREEGKEETLVVRAPSNYFPLDSFCSVDGCRIYIAEGQAYSKILNCCNVAANNNKFYILQLLESQKERGSYFLWRRWGRVGSQGQSALVKFSNRTSAIQDFERKLSEKLRGNYVEIQLDYPNEEEKEDRVTNVRQASPLPIQVQNLVKLIFDLDMIKAQLNEFGYDFRKVPIDKLSPNAIQKGYAILKEIEKAIEKRDPRDVLTELSSHFYTLIPHDVGFRRMSDFLLDSGSKLKEKLEMLTSLEQISIAVKLLQNPNHRAENNVDANYNKLKCELQLVERNSEQWKFIQEYVQNTHGAIHSNYSLEIEDIFTTVREGEEGLYTRDLHNKQLLWYGSRLTNFAAILSQGLKIAPPEAPTTGYMFGKGVYFTDMVSKAANYCFTNLTNNTGLMLLCEVALGECNEKIQADYNAANLPLGKQSTKGIGRTQPAPNQNHKIDGDIIVPLGKGEPSLSSDTALLYNEYVVYDTRQIKLRYLLKMKFNYRTSF